MATSTTKVLCRYFMNGSCSKGALCTFSHDWKDQPDMVCRYYLQGQCLYGDKCRYDHIRPKHGQNIHSSNQEDGEAKSKKTGPSMGPVLLPSQSGSGSKEVTDQPKLVALTRDPSKTPRQWVQALEFIPGKSFHGVEDEESEAGPALWEVGPQSQPPTYSCAASTGLELESQFLDIITVEEAASIMCPFAEMGACPFGDRCEYKHGDMCELCNRECLSPFDPEQRKAHHKECLKSHEQEMERAFAVQKSEGKSCGICMEVVLCKVALSDRRFGVLSDCDHCFCLGCIRKWRGSTHTHKKTIRACPLCRSISYLVIPSQVWVDEEEEKKKLIENYKSNLGQQHCKHFNRGKGTCPFGNSCFYKHEYSDGTKATVQVRVAVDYKGEGKFIGHHTLWQYIEERDDRYVAEWGSSSDSDGDLLP